MSERIGLIIFGATGFTGKYTVEEVHRIAKNDKSITWAIAGRSQLKLEKIIKDLQDKTGDDLTKIKIILADVNDLESLKEMTKQAKVIINCCGPYRFYGEPVVRACVRTKTNYVDVSSEILFMERMQLLYNESAQKAEVYIISACGLDSIPGDLGITFLEQNFKGQVNSAESYLKMGVNRHYPRKFGEAATHYGAWKSLIYGIDEQDDLRPVRFLLYPQKMPEMLPKLNHRFVVHKNDVTNDWCVPFRKCDQSTVYRSQRFFYTTEKKRPVQLRAHLCFPSLFYLSMVLFSMFIIAIIAKFKCGMKLLLTYPRLFSFGSVSHEGPSEDRMKNTKFAMTICGKGWDETQKDFDGKPTTKIMKVKISGVNPGYGATCTALVFSALTIMKESDKMPGKGGVLTPGAAFSKTTLIENLNENGIKFEVID